MTKQGKDKSQKQSRTPPQVPAGIHIGISDEDRAAIAKGLSALLADTYTLYLTTHNFHWNVTGPMFNTLHTMFMAQYTELWNAVDPVAERIRALGHHAPAPMPSSASSPACPMHRRSRPRPWRWCASWCRATRPWRARLASCFPVPTRPATSLRPIC
jgi:hypothetical protein